MAGVLLPQDEVRIPGDSASLVAYALPMASAGYDPTLPAASGVYSNTQPIDEPGRAFSGALADSFREDWYFRVHIIPNPLDIGNLIADLDRQLEVFNAWFDDRRLDDIIASGGDGITLTEPVVRPYVYRPLESLMYDLSVSADGPTVIDASYQFVFAGEIPTLRITGLRVVLWPFGVNWQQPVLDRMGWLTDVMVHHDGSEQRQRLRRWPRRTIEYRMSAGGDDRGLMTPLLAGWQGRYYVLPLWMVHERLSVDAAIGAVQLVLDDVGPEFVADDFAVLYQDVRRYEVVEVASVEANVVTLIRPLAQNWLAGVRVYPARAARLSAQQQVSRITAGIADAVLSWEIKRERMESLPDAWPTYRAAPVLERMPNGREPVAYDWQRTLARLDNGVGVPYVRDPSDWGSTAESFLHTWRNRDEIRAWMGWCQHLGGRHRGFWSPTWVQDMRLVALMAASDVQMDIRAIGYARLLQAGEGWRDLRIALRDGAVFYRRILDAAEAGADVERLVLDAALGVDVDPADVRIISFMQWGRLDADMLEMQWATDGIAECAVPVRRLRDEG